MQPAEQYTIRQKVLVFLGASFHIFDASGRVIGFCRQKALRLREDIRVYADEARTNELFAMKARSILDFSTTYDITMPGDLTLGSLRRKGLSSLLRDEWTIFSPIGTQIGRIVEDSTGMALVRRFVPLGGLIPQRFHVESAEGRTVAVFRTHFNPFVYRLGVAILDPRDERFDDILILAAAALIAAIEGRQSNDAGGTGLFSGD